MTNQDLELAEATARERGLELRRDDLGLVLVGGDLELRGDLARVAPRLRHDRLSQELLVRAAKLRPRDTAPLRAVDATAGLGEDAMLLAAAGFEVTLFERDPVVFALLYDALVRAKADSQLANVAARMTLVAGDSVQGLGSLGFVPDVVFLDPMFPAKRKSSATNKKLQLLQALESPATDEEALLAAAIAAGPRKVVVKRPPKGPSLAGRKPSHVVRGKAVRYDCYALAGVPTRSSALE